MNIARDARMSIMRDGRGSVAVEFALMVVFILFPLVAGAVDLIGAIQTQTALNTALRSFYYYAWNASPDADGKCTSSAFTVGHDYPATGCPNAIAGLAAGGAGARGALGALLGYVNQGAAPGSPISLAGAYCYVPSASGPCPGDPGTPCAEMLPPYVTPAGQVYVCYRLQAPVNFPVSVPPFTATTLAATGAVRIY